jgi:hypothetical protein
MAGLVDQLLQHRVFLGLGLGKQMVVLHALEDFLGFRFGDYGGLPPVLL